MATTSTPVYTNWFHLLVVAPFLAGIAIYSLRGNRLPDALAWLLLAAALVAAGVHAYLLYAKSQRKE